MAASFLIKNILRSIIKQFNDLKCLIIFLNLKLNIRGGINYGKDL